MLKRAINEFEIGLRITTESPLLVKDGRYESIRAAEAESDNRVNKLTPNAVPISRCSDGEMVKAIRAELPHARASDAASAMEGFPFYIPGSSLRGAWRSWLERTLRYHERPG